MSGAFSAGIVLSTVLLAFVCMALSSWGASWKCLGAPYLYVTFHRDEKGVRKYSRDGCFLSKNVLSGDRHDRSVKEARDLQVGTYRGQEALYVVQALSQSSAVLVYGQCDARGHRRLLGVGPTIEQTPGLNHPYGLAFDSSGAMYVSCQHTNTVMRFEKDTFLTSPLPSSLADVPLIEDTNTVPSIHTALYPGTFFQYEVFPESSHRQKKYDLEERKEGVRDVVFVEENLWIASEDIRGVSVVAPSGEEIHRISFGKLKPVGLFYDRTHSLVFVSTRGKSSGPVWAVDPVTHKVMREYCIEGQLHSTGMVVYEDTLFVASQELGAILSYDIPSGRSLGVAVSHFPDTIERLALSDC